MLKYDCCCGLLKHWFFLDRFFLGCCWRETMEGKAVKKESEQEQDYPGFRFQPTEEELVGFYLKRKSQGKLSSFRYIPVIDLYKYDPWQLTFAAKEGAKEMYFFVEKDESSQRKCGRPNRIAASGYWKATGSDRSIWDDSTKLLGHKKTLVFYRGKAPRGEKTNWVMNEFRLPESQNEVVLCRIHKKATPQKWLEKQAYLNAQLLQQQQQQQSRHNSSNCNSVSNNSHSYSDDKCPEESTATPEPESEDANSSKCNCSHYEEESMTAATTNTNTNTTSNNSNSNFINTINTEGPVHNGNLFSATGLTSLEAILCEDIKPPLEIPINSAIIDWKELKFDPAASAAAAASFHINSSKPLPWEDLWSPSSLLCTPKDYSLGTPHFPKF